MTKHEKEFYKKLAEEFNYKPLDSEDQPIWLSSKRYNDYLEFIEDYKKSENDLSEYFS